VSVESSIRSMFSFYVPRNVYWNEKTQIIVILYMRVAGKAFDITYIRLLFYSPRPESFAIYKKSTEDGQWTPYQFYRWVAFVTRVHNSEIYTISYGLRRQNEILRRETCTLRVFDTARQACETLSLDQLFSTGMTWIQCRVDTKSSGKRNKK